MQSRKGGVVTTSSPHRGKVQSGRIPGMVLQSPECILGMVTWHNKLLSSFMEGGHLAL